MKEYFWLIIASIYVTKTAGGDEKEAPIYREEKTILIKKFGSADRETHDFFYKSILDFLKSIHYQHWPERVKLPTVICIQNGKSGPEENEENAKELKMYLLKKLKNK